MSSSRNHKGKLKIRTWALCILPINTVDSADTFWINFFNIFKYLGIKTESAINKTCVMQAIKYEKDIGM
jgi:hypothetical protein